MNKTSLAVLAAAVLALSIGTTAAVRADDSSTPPPSATAPEHHGHGGHFMKALGLTQDQIAQMKTIRQSFRSQAEAIKNNTKLSDADKKAQFKALRKSTRSQMEAILTPDQKAKLQQLREQRRQARENADNGNTDNAAPQSGSTDTDQ